MRNATKTHEPSDQAGGASRATGDNGERPPASTDILIGPNRPKYLTLGKAAALCPKPVSRWAVYGWCRRGQHGIRLRYIRQGKLMFTTVEWLEAFIRAVTDADVRAAEARDDRRLPSHTQADRELREAGL